MTALIYGLVAGFCLGVMVTIAVILITGAEPGIPATRRTIGRDQRRKRLGLADVPRRVLERPVGCRCELGLGECRACFQNRTGLTVQEAGKWYGDPARAPTRSDARITNAIGKLDDGEPKFGWQAGVWARLKGAWRRG